mgnify:CR=1 FL=1
MCRSLKKSFQFRNNCVLQLQDAYLTIQNQEEIQDVLLRMLIRRTAPGAVPAPVHDNMAISVFPVPEGEILNQFIQDNLG